MSKQNISLTPCIAGIFHEGKILPKLGLSLLSYENFFFGQGGNGSYIQYVMIYS